MGEVMQFPNKWEHFLQDYEFEDSRRIYTNGARLIPSFRVKQMMEHYLSKAEVRAKDEKAKGDICAEVIKRQDKEIEDLKDKNKHLAVSLTEAKSEAIKEFAERVKTELTTGATIMRVSTLDVIDNLVIEMTEGV